MSGAGVTKMSHLGYHFMGGMDTPECVEKLTIPICLDMREYALSLRENIRGKNTAM